MNSVEGYSSFPIMEFTDDMLNMETDKTSLTYLCRPIDVAMATVTSDEIKQEIFEVCGQYTADFRGRLLTKSPYVIAVEIKPLFFKAFPDVDVLAFSIGMWSRCYNVFTRSGGKFSLAEYEGEMRFTLRSMDLVELISQMGVEIDGIKIDPYEHYLFLTLPPKEAFGNIKSQVGDLYQELYGPIDDIFKRWQGEIDTHVETFGAIPILDNKDVRDDRLCLQPLASPCTVAADVTLPASSPVTSPMTCFDGDVWCTFGRLPPPPLE